MIIPDRKNFFESARATLFNNNMSQSQVEGVNSILDAWETYAEGIDPRWIAYSLATTYHETMRTMQPVKEIGGGAGRPYGQVDRQTQQAYYGRGYVQLTWRVNYARMASVVGADLVNHPDLALHPAISAKILTEGMSRGLFTGKKLQEFFFGTRSDWIDARAIINGTDRAALVAGYALHWYSAMTEKDL